jgi:hypothetical protein
MLTRMASKIGWLFASGGLALGLSGCAPRPLLSGLLPKWGETASRTTLDPSDQGNATAVPRSLATIPYDQREATWLDGATAPLLGRVLAEETPTGVRQLSLAHCESLAVEVAPIGVQLRQHAQWLEAHGQATLSASLREQARFEADKHRLLAVEAYVNLTNVYAQTTVIDQSLTFLSDLRESIAEFRRAGIEVAVTNNELDRQELAIQESIVELQYSQTRLIGGLEVLLQVTANPQPIWTFVTDESPRSVVDVAAAGEFALQHRGDLKALQILAADADSIPAETLQQLHPLLATGVPIPSVRWWMCLAKREADCLEQNQLEQRQRLLEAMVVAKIEQIRTEVADRCLALQRVESLLELKIQQRALLRDAQQNRTQAGQGSVDVAAYVADSQQELKWTSEIISLMFERQIEQARLQHAMGTGAPGR